MKNQSSSTHCSKVISKVKVSERRTEWHNYRMTDRTKTICPPIFYLGRIKISFRTTITFLFSSLIILENTKFCDITESCVRRKQNSRHRWESFKTKSHQQRSLKVSASLAARRHCVENAEIREGVVFRRSKRPRVYPNWKHPIWQKVLKERLE